MKNNKVLIIIGIVFLNLLVVYMVGQSLLGKTSQYEQTIAKARSYAEEELCSKSIEKYNEAILTKDTVELRLEMIDVYEKGIDIGEFTNTYDVFLSVTTMVDIYSEENIVYEAACELFMKYGKYEDCAKVLMKARDFHVTSEKIEEYRNQVRYQYTEYFAMYTDIQPLFDGMYLVETDGKFTYLNDECTPEIESEFTYASSFSEGYAFVKGIHPDGTEKSFVINKDGMRQAYLDGVEASSGVGKAKNKSGDDILLLACQTDGKYQYFDINGNKCLDEYVFAGRFRNNVAAVQESEGKWKLIDGTGKAITDKTFSDVILNEFDECAPKGLIIAKEKDEYHIYDLEAKKIGDFACDDAKAFVDKYAAFKNGEKWGFVDSEGKVIIEAQYEDAKSFSNNMGAVKTGDVWQFISPKNEIAIQDTFEEVDYLSNKGICFVKMDGYWSYLKMYYTGE